MEGVENHGILDIGLPHDSAAMKNIVECPQALENRTIMWSRNLIFWLSQRTAIEIWNINTTHNSQDVRTA